MILFWEKNGAWPVKKQKVKKKKEAKHIENTVYVTPKGKKYHRKDCRYIRNGASKIDKEEAEKEGYTPCKVCKP